MQLGGRPAAELSEAAQSELLELCEDQFAQLEKVNEPECADRLCLARHERSALQV